MNAIEQEIVRVAVKWWGHPSWRNRVGPPTYFMTADSQVFCRFLPARDSHLVAWHWFDPQRFGWRQPQLIRGIEHLQELVATLKDHVSAN